MGILNFFAGEVCECVAEGFTVPADAEFFTSGSRGNAVASNPPPVAVRNSRRSTDLPRFERSMQSPDKD
jgi:hypothetical protein